jgi:hypothetical protein
MATPRTEASTQCERVTEAGSDADGLILVPGTRVRMRPPARAQPGSGFAGFMWPEDIASIMITEWPAPYAEISEPFTTSQGAIAPGLTLLRRKEVDVNGCVGVLVELEMVTKEITFRRQLLVCGDDKSTLMVASIYPETTAHHYAEAFRNALTSVSWDRTITADTAAGLDWDLDAPIGMQPEKEVGSGGLGLTGRFYSEDGTTGPNPDAPSFGAMQSLGDVSITDLKTAAETRLRELAKGLATVREVQIETSDAFEVAGLEGWEITAREDDERAGGERTVYLAMLAHGHGYVIFFGEVGAADPSVWIPRFRTATRSWHPLCSPHT